MKLETSKESEVIQFLNNLADIKDYYMHRFNSTNRCLIHYFDKQGKSWALMEDDDEFVSWCVEYLRKINAPEFDDIEEMKAFEARRSERKLK